jgi:hypothetical protein
MRKGGLPFAFQSPGSPQENDIMKRIGAFVAASAMRSRGGLRQNAWLVEHAGPVHTGRFRSIRQ